MMLAVVRCALLLVFFLVVSASAQDARLVQVELAAGANGTGISDSIRGRDTVSYQIGAEAGQKLAVTLAPSNLATYFNVYAPGNGPGDEAIANSGLTGLMVPELNRFEGRLPVSGVYTVSIYLLRAAARRDEVSDYRLQIALTGKPGQVVEGDFADGLAGGPDFWAVRTARDESSLRLRAAASTGAEVMAGLANGQILRNLGCRMAEGMRWCRVAVLDDGREGWVAGAYLVEGSDLALDKDRARTDTTSVVLSSGGPDTGYKGNLGPGQAMNYVLEGRSGQSLSVALATESHGAHFNIFSPDGSSLYESVAAGGGYRGTMRQDGGHTVTVYNSGDDAAAYEITFGIEEAEQDSLP
ncbi:MAG: SH3 domain-containing protein [Rhodobacteraceae bacterium]|nr:SH3 domain-containing protein [Paracoccaceae bacterium]